MAFWSTDYHRSRHEVDSQQAISVIRDDVLEVKLLVGNEATENTLVHDVADIKQSKMDRSDGVALEDRLKRHAQFKLDETAAGIRKDMTMIRKMKGPRGERGSGWMAGEGAPTHDLGRTGDLYVDVGTLLAYKKLDAGWMEFSTLRGPQGPPTFHASPGPFHLSTIIGQHTYFYVYTHPSRFQLINRTAPGVYTASTILDFTGKSISAEGVRVSKDADGHFYIDLDRSPLSIPERFDRLFADNKAFAIFQVLEITGAEDSPTELFEIGTVARGNLLRRPYGRYGALTGGGQYVIPSLSVSLFSDKIGMEKFTSNFEGSGTIELNNATVGLKLTSAFGQSVSRVQDMIGRKCVMSYSRDSDGLFAIRINSIQIHSVVDSRPFHRINGIEDCKYMIGAGGVHLYCHLHFSKSLNQTTIKRIHAELMAHYGLS